MTSYTNESTFVLFKNDKGNNPKRPDYRGTLHLHGEEFKLSAWLREKKDGSGQKYMSGKLTRAEVAPATPATDQAASAPTTTDDIPF